jgi:hypothetical protein
MMNASDDLGDTKDGMNQDDSVFDPSTILEMDASLFDDYEEDYGDDESIDVEEGEELEVTNTNVSSQDIFTHVVSSLRPIIDYDIGHEKDNEDFLEELVRNGLFVFNHNFGSPEVVNAAMKQLKEAHFFTSKHDNARRSLSISTTGSSLHRVMDIMLDVPIFVDFFAWLRKTFGATITNLWAYHFIKEGSGSFAFHRDRYKSTYRLIFTFGNSSKGKRMRFINRVTGKTVALKIAHGTVVGMSRIVSGADRERGGMYYHEVYNCSGTTSFGVQMTKLRRTFQPPENMNTA